MSGVTPNSNIGCEWCLHTAVSQAWAPSWATHPAPLFPPGRPTPHTPKGLLCPSPAPFKPAPPGPILVWTPASPTPKAHRHPLSAVLPPQSLSFPFASCWPCQVLPLSVLPAPRQHTAHPQPCRAAGKSKGRRHWRVFAEAGSGRGRSGPLTECRALALGLGPWCGLWRQQLAELSGVEGARCPGRRV